VSQLRNSCHEKALNSGGAGADAHSMRLLRRLRSQRGYSLVELLVVMGCLGIVLGGLTTAFVSATNAQVIANARFQAESTAQVGLSALRNEVHCASSLNSGWSATSITLTLPAGCPDTAGATTSMSWCTSNVAASRYALYRQTGTTCGTSGILVADYVTNGSVFSYTCSSGSGLRPVLTVTLSVDIDPAHSPKSYTLGQDLAFRNAGRC
jgi:prepilin-type N-terminal cleavage/methylation domain-containing protein